MTASLGGFRAALFVGWLVLSAAGLLYARFKGIPAWAAVPLLAAFLLEFTFYLVPGFESARDRLEQWSRRRLSGALIASMLLPWLVYAIPTGQFRWDSLIRLAALAITVVLWYFVLPESHWTDFAYVALLAAVVLRKFFDAVYSPPHPDLHIEVLGQITLIHTTALVMLLIRRVPGIGFGFVPARHEWRAGLKNYAYALIIVFPIAQAAGLIQFDPAGFSLWKTAANFIAFLWVVALSEEFFFRGLLQQWLEDWTCSPPIGLALASVIFGLCHLPFRGFPNWKMAAVAAVAGWFYGRAYQQTGSIRSSMVAHALVVTTWRSLF